ncbi:MAG: hypothetical protein L6Q55_02925 [Azonexus sp.]|nr:hypothetical protein [Azonexus sp.]MCK6411359.1 hypothetical protein [Azonexus sp.]
MAAPQAENKHGKIEKNYRTPWRKQLGKIRNQAIVNGVHSLPGKGCRAGRFRSWRKRGRNPEIPGAKGFLTRKTWS